MHDARSRGRGTTLEPVRDGFGLAPRLRLFALLALLAPLFWGLQLMVREQAPRVEVRLVYPDPGVATAPVPAPAERIVERIVYVPIAPSGQAPSAGEATPDLQKPADEASGAAQPSEVASIASAVDVRDVEHASATDVGGSPAEPPGLTGIVALAPVPAPVPADISPPAPVVVAAAPPARAAAAPVVVAAPADDADVPIEADEEQDEPVAAFDQVAEATPSTEDDEGDLIVVQVVDTTIDADQSTHVAYYLVPARLEAVASDGGSAQVSLDADDELVADADDADAESDDVVMYADDGAADEADEPEAAGDVHESDAAAESSPGQPVTVLATTSDGTTFESESGQ